MIRNANGVTAIYLIRWRKRNIVDMQYYLPDHPQFGYAEGGALVPQASTGALLTKAGGAEAAKDAEICELKAKLAQMESRLGGAPLDEQQLPVQD